MKQNRLFLILTLLIITSCATNEEEIILFSKGFTGTATVIFSQSDGKPIKYYEGERVYEIPLDGILKTQFTEQSGWSSLPKFYYGDINEENRIENRIYENLPLDTIVGFGPTSGSMQINKNGDQQIRFVKFYIGDRLRIDTEMKKIGRLDTIKFDNISN